MGVNAIAFKTDVSKAENVEALAEKALATFGHISCWVNNAGVGAVGEFTIVPLAVHEQIIRTNLLGTIYGSYAAIKIFRAQDYGVLIPGIRAGKNYLALLLCLLRFKIWDHRFE